MTNRWLGVERSMSPMAMSSERNTVPTSRDRPGMRVRPSPRYAGCQAPYRPLFTMNPMMASMFDPMRK